MVDRLSAHLRVGDEVVSRGEMRSRVFEFVSILQSSGRSRPTM
jgi:hypothetical protein